MEKDKRIDFFDIAKGIAIISVIAGHLGLDEINRIVYTFHLPVFYFIAGYFLSFRKPMKKFAKDKAKRLLIPYAVTCSAVMAGTFVTGLIMARNMKLELYELKEWFFALLYGAGDIWEEPFHIRGIGAVWFLLALFWGLLFSRFCLEKFRERAVFLAAASFLCVMSAQYIWLPLSIQAGGTAALYIVIGYGAKKADMFGGEPSAAGLLAALAALALGVLKFNGFWLVHNYFGNGICDFLVSLCGIYAVMTVSKAAEKYAALKKPLLFFGKNSLYVLCFHTFEGYVLPWNLFTAYMTIDMGINDFWVKPLVFALKLAFISAATAAVIGIKRVIAAKHSFTPPLNVKFISFHRSAAIC